MEPSPSGFPGPLDGWDSFQIAPLGSPTHPPPTYLLLLDLLLGGSEGGWGVEGWRDALDEGKLKQQAELLLSASSLAAAAGPHTPAGQAGGAGGTT